MDKSDELIKKEKQEELLALKMTALTLENQLLQSNIGAQLTLTRIRIQELEKELK